MRVRIPVCSFLCLCLVSGNLHGAKKAEPKKPEAPPPVYYVVEVCGLFNDRSVSVCTDNKLQAVMAGVSDKNNAASLAYKRVSEQWAKSEKERVEAEAEQRKKQKRKGGKLPRRPVAKPFVLPMPGLVSLKTDGPYDDMAEAKSKAEEQKASISKAVEFAAGSEAQRKEIMSPRVLASVESKEALKEEQKALFLAAVESLKGKSSLMASGGNVKKKIGGKITPLVKNMHRMMKPKAGSKTATKVDSRAVQN